ncbi:MAG: aminoacetone oxidase family FAD-binding enzyme [Bacillota bacterium]|nr:aminoacetone oxidase family FAD-binding enzyme [Bacillota bacterium]
MKITVEKQAGIAVMGGGAAGMAAAIAAARALREEGAGETGPSPFRGGDAEVLVLEKNARPGRKLLATGNGRCNFTNSRCSWKDYRSKGPAELREFFVRQVLEELGPAELRRFFESLGVFSREEEGGRVYPYSGQAAGLREAMERELERQGAELLTETRVDRVEKRPEGFALILESGALCMARRLIVATGGRAGIQYGSTGDGYGVAKALGHTLAPPSPALVQLVAESPELPELKGVRAKGRVSLLEQGRELGRASGEIQFTEDALSGICVFDLSGLLDRQKAREGAYQAEIDLFPEWQTGAFTEKLLQRQAYLPELAAEQFLEGILHKKLCGVYIRRWTAEPKDKVGNLPREKIEELAALLKCWRLPLSGTRGWAEAQTTAGGVELSQVDAETMGSRLVPGLYFAGEVLDVDGPCGGYNLHWAFASGIRAGQGAARP